MENYKGLFNLAGKTALIIGGSGGLGKAIASGFIQEGANVIVCGLHPEKAEDLRICAEKYNTGFLAVKVDILDGTSIKEMIEITMKKFGRIDILVNSAGINILKSAEQYDEDIWDKVVDINLKGTHLVTKEVGKIMINQRYGKIINLSSVRSILGMPQNYIAYCASKGAINMYTKQIACEWAKYNITSNAIAPTFVRTTINEKQLDDEVFFNQLISRIPMGRIGQLKDIVAAAIYLASDASSFVTGHVLVIDGGLTATQ